MIKHEKLKISRCIVERVVNDGRKKNSTTWTGKDDEITKFSYQCHSMTTRGTKKKQC